MFKECVGCGRVYEGLLAEQQRHTRIISSECGFKYLRLHDLLHDDMGVYSENHKGEPVYNWQYIDLLYDYILSIGMKPFVELGFMPQALASGSETVFWWKGNVTPPKSYEKWENLIYELVMHFTKRYGHDEVSTWYFEEPSPPKTHFHGGFGLLNVQGLKKPSFFAYKYLNQLGDIELKCNDDNLWICKNDKGLQILLWDYTYVDQNYIPNQTYYKKDLPSLPAEKIQLCLSNLKPGKHLLSVYSIGYKQNDVYTEFLDIDFSGTMSKEQVEILTSKTTGLPIIQKEIIIKDGKDFVYEIDLRDNDVFLVTIEYLQNIYKYKKT